MRTPPEDLEGRLIERYFERLGAERADVALGIGDDAAVLDPPVGEQLVATTDALVCEAHFERGASPLSVGHRALAVNLSDLAAMGATPRWALLSLIMERVDEAWLDAFAQGFGALARATGVALVGGNLSRGPLSVTVQLIGSVPNGTALRRDRGAAGHDLYVSGTVGDAAAGRTVQQDPSPRSPDAQALIERFEFPTARIGLGLALRGLASACIDVSDGLYLDAARLAAASGCAAQLWIERLPISPPLRRVAGTHAVEQALAGGEDYELCFSAAPGRRAELVALADRLAVPLTRIGVLAAGDGLQLLDNGTSRLPPVAFAHFRV